jgi:hypothetical protein
VTMRHTHKPYPYSSGTYRKRLRRGG